MDTITKIKWRIENKEWLQESKRIALNILLRLDDLGWTKTRLSKESGLSEEFINTLMKGNKKFEPEILGRLEGVLRIKLKPRVNKNRPLK